MGDRVRRRVHVGRGAARRPTAIGGRVPDHAGCRADDGVRRRPARVRRVARVTTGRPAADRRGRRRVVAGADDARVPRGGRLPPRPLSGWAACRPAHGARRHPRRADHRRGRRPGVRPRADRRVVDRGDGQPARDRGARAAGHGRRSARRASSSMRQPSSSPCSRSCPATAPRIPSSGRRSAGSAAAGAVPLALVPFILVADWLWSLWYVSTMLLPLAIGVALLRYRLFDIDRIVGRTIAYAIVTAILAGVFVVVNLRSLRCSRTRRAPTRSSSRRRRCSSRRCSSRSGVGSRRPWTGGSTAPISMRNAWSGTFARQTRDEVDLERLQARCRRHDRGVRRPERDGPVAAAGAGPGMTRYRT